MQKMMLTVQKAAQLMESNDRQIQRMIGKGLLSAESIPGNAGQGGLSYRIPLSALPAEAQIRYYEECGRAAASAEERQETFDLGAYVRKAGETGMQTLLKRQQAVLRMIGLRESGTGELTQAFEETAAAYGMSAQTLRRLEKRYREKGLAGLVRGGRSDKGESRSMCQEAARRVRELYLKPEKLSASAIADKVAGMAYREGPEACAHCPYNPESAEHHEKALVGEAEWYPACDRTGGGLIPPPNRHAANRVIQAQISQETADYARNGAKYWRDVYMTKVEREKPNMVNQCWFGDHHRFDLFVIDERGKAVRPWLTAWYDIGSGRITGWAVSTRPNSQTITESLLRGIADKNNSDIYGVPGLLYMDNGKDYRSKRFEGVPEVEEYLACRDPEMMEKMYSQIVGLSVVQTLGIRVKHSRPYYGEAKPIERWFRTLEERYCRQLPGYCGGTPEDRPENFDRELRQRMKRGSLMTLDELTDVFQNQILPAYDQRPHQGYGGETPAARYARLPKLRSEHVGWAMLSMARELEEVRSVTAQGFKFRNRIYWSEELLHMAGQKVILRFTDCAMETVSVLDLRGNYLCEAEPREALSYIDEAPEKVSAHIAMQARQQGEVLQDIRALGGRVPGKRASGNLYYPAVDESAGGNITSLKAEKIARGRAAQKKRREAEAEWSVADEFFANWSRNHL